MDYETAHTTSPPTRISRALRSLMTPWLVETTVIPSPSRSRGIDSAPQYTRHPEWETRSMRLMRVSPRGPYFNWTRRSPWRPSGITSNPMMKPSSRNTSKTPRLRRLLRQVTFLRRIDTALRMRVNISAVRSCNDMVWSLNIVLSNKYRRSELPRSFSHAWDHSQQRQLAQHVTTDSELSVIRAGMSRDLAAISFSRRKLRRNLHFCKYAFTCHSSPY